MHETIHLLEKTDFPKIFRSKVETLQVNLGYLCNQSCTHCHVDAGPNRTEMMASENIDTVVDYVQAQGINALDLTGGAPELHSQFRELVKIARSQSVHVIDRCNLTILEEPNQEDLAEFLAEHEVAEEYGISFDHLFTITNMPIKRFGSMLVSKGKFDEYMQLLRDAYSVDNLQSVMCRSMLSVDWQGFAYDCDFNQMLGMSLPHNDQIRTHLSEIMNTNIEQNEISIANHCYGCTAGQGSSCGGALN
jgi:MoaA/NifB/PqqE/SkfB family radical SAM enzyme